MKEILTRLSPLPTLAVANRVVNRATSTHKEKVQTSARIYCLRLDVHGKVLQFSLDFSKFRIQSRDTRGSTSLGYCTTADDVAKKRLEDMDLTSLESAEERILMRLQYLMDMMEVEKAVRLVRKSAKIRVIPPKKMLLNLIQQLANLGEYASLLDLYRVIKDEDLFSSSEFFHQLEQAYSQSQRIDEAVIMLRILYHGIRKYEEVDLLFTTICMMILRHFPSEIKLMQGFVDDCMNAEKGQKNFRPAAGLWKCYVLNEDIQGASKVLTLSDQVQNYIPDMVTDIVTNKNKVAHNRDTVLMNLVSMKDLPLDDEHRKTLVADSVEYLFHNSSWRHLLTVLQTVENSDVDKEFLNNLLSLMETSDNSDFELILCIEEANNILKRKQRA